MANYRGEFERSKNWQEFDSMVTKSLQKFSNDGHLYVRYNPEVVATLKSATPEKEDNEHMKDSQRATDNNYGFRESKIIGDNVGYLKISEINLSKSSLPALYAAMQSVENTRALIIDLRDNGGGGSEVGAVLESYFLPAGIPILQFVKRNGGYSSDSTVSWLQEKKYDKPVYIIINRNTASAAEAFAFVLQQNKRAGIAGETSAGAAYMNEWFPVNDENFVSVSTAAPGLPGSLKSWEQKGVEPDIKVRKGDPVEYIMDKYLGK
jgi:C-terminal processing protease CtpA/Prc